MWEDRFRFSHVRAGLFPTPGLLPFSPYTDLPIKPMLSAAVLNLHIVKSQVGERSQRGYIIEGREQ